MVNVYDLGTSYSEDTLRRMEEQQHQEKCRREQARRAANIQRIRERQENTRREEAQREAKRRRNW